MDEKIRKKKTQDTNRQEEIDTADLQIGRRKWTKNKKKKTKKTTQGKKWQEEMDTADLQIDVIREIEGAITDSAASISCCPPAPSEAFVFLSFIFL